MAKGITIEVDKRDLRRLNDAIAEYARVRKVDNAYAVNRTAKDVAFRAVKYTKAADRGKVESDLKRDIKIETVGRSGKPLTRPRSSFLPTSLARRVFASRLRAGTVHYKGFPTGKVEPSSIGRGRFDALLKKYIGRRVGSVDFIRAGFLGAAKKFLKFKGGETSPKLKGRKSGKGRGVLAVAGNNATATIINFATSKSTTSNTALFRYASEGVNKAIRDKTADIKRFVKDQLTKQAQRFNRK